MTFRRKNKNVKNEPQLRVCVSRFSTGMGSRIRYAVLETLHYYENPLDLEVSKPSSVFMDYLGYSFT